MTFCLIAVFPSAFLFIFCNDSFVGFRCVSYEGAFTENNGFIRFVVSLDLGALPEVSFLLINRFFVFFVLAENL